MISYNKSRIRDKEIENEIGGTRGNFVEDVAKSKYQP